MNCLCCDFYFFDDSYSTLKCVHFFGGFISIKNFRFEKSGHLIGNEYFLHAYGPIYVLSAEVVASLAAARNNRFAFALSLIPLATF